MIDEKLMPQCTELEESVIGCALLHYNIAPLIFEILKPEMFYDERNKFIWKTILDLQKEKKPFDIYTLSAYLIGEHSIDKAGGIYRLTGLTQRPSSPHNIEFQSRIIIQRFVQRKLIQVSEKMQNDAFVVNAEIFSLLSDSQIEIQNLERTIITGGAVRNIASVINEERNEYYSREIMARDGMPTGVNTGFSELNILTGGWQKSDLIILAARPGMGKTALALHFMISSDNVAFFSLEMKDTQLTTRLILADADASSTRYRQGKLYTNEAEKTEYARQKIEGKNIFIDDTPSISIIDLKQKCRKLKTQNNIQLIIVDYLQLMTTGEKNSNRNREQEISIISSGLKAIAKELDVPVIALSQMNRAVETRGGDKKPQLSDLRESGAIEQDADMVIFVHRPEYYGIKEDGNGDSTEGVCMLMVSKHRNGGLADIKTKYIADRTRFEDLYTPFETVQHKYNPNAGLIPVDFTQSKNESDEEPF